MKRFISLIIAIVLHINQNNFCFGFQLCCGRRSSNPSFSNNLYNHNQQLYINTIRYMAESSSEDDNSKTVKVPKRQRFKDLVKRMPFIRRREEYKQKIIQDDIPKDEDSIVSSSELAQMLRESADTVEKKENNSVLSQTIKALTSYVDECTDDEDSVASNESTVSDEILLSNNETLPEDTKSADDISVSSSRSSKAADNVNLSGTWRPIVTPEFKEEYDEYLKNCSQSYMFRKIAVNGISLQKEIFRQLNDGVDLEISELFCVIFLCI